MELQSWGYFSRKIPRLSLTGTIRFDAFLLSMSLRGAEQLSPLGMFSPLFFFVKVGEFSTVIMADSTWSNPRYEFEFPTGGELRLIPVS